MWKQTQRQTARPAGTPIPYHTRHHPATRCERYVRYVRYERYFAQ